MHLDIKNDAIFVADVHYNKKRDNFLQFLDDILKKNIKTSQLILMGDIFDFLSKEADYFIKSNKLAIDKINYISKNIEVVYLEGNHDYNLDKVFTSVSVIKRKYQPLIAKYKNKTLAISHGDIFTPSLYNTYTYIIRNHYLLKFLNFIDNGTLVKIIENKLMQKKICKEIDFIKLAQDRINKYSNIKVDIIIEGHFHQGKSYKNYINIPSFACSYSYGQIDDINNIIKTLVYR